jgi:small subunit ribosomal protein S20
MAHTLSAKKRIRQNVKQRARNRWRKRQVKEDIREFFAALHGGNASAAEQALRQVSKRLDQVAAKRSIHPNAAARTKSRLSRRLNALRAKAAA